MFVERRRLIFSETLHLFILPLSAVIGGTCWHVENSCAKVKYLIPVLKVFLCIFWSSMLASFADFEKRKDCMKGLSVVASLIE